MPAGIHAPERSVKRLNDAIKAFESNVALAYFIYLMTHLCLGRGARRPL